MQRWGFIFNQFAFEPALEQISWVVVPFRESIGNGEFAGSALTIHKTREDVNLDFVVTALDALVLINSVNQRTDSLMADGSELKPWWHDVNGDGWVAPMDVLIVVNYLNRQAALGEGEGLAAATDVKDTPTDTIPPSLAVSPSSTGSYHATSVRDEIGIRPVSLVGASNVPTTFVPTTMNSRTDPESDDLYSVARANRRDWTSRQAASHKNRPPSSKVGAPQTYWDFDPTKIPFDELESALDEIASEVGRV